MLLKGERFFFFFLKCESVGKIDYILYVSVFIVARVGYINTNQQVKIYQGDLETLICDNLALIFLLSLPATFPLPQVTE